jgi:DNA repair protein RadD
MFERSEVPFVADDDQIQVSHHELQLRDYQVATLEALRQGFAQGHRAQILYAPTGAGKTETAIALLAATRQKGNRAAMILDRIILCDQTSQRLEKYNIPHGVLQSGHWRYRPYEWIQVCSAQTLEKRGSFPDLSLLVVDEAHAQREQTLEFIKNNPTVKVIGLTATPFTKGLGDTYTNVVSVITTDKLVQQSVLVPLKVFVCKEINMEGAKKVAGEWSQKEVETRGVKITGDIVAEWTKKTHEFFGGPAKTIVFCAGVNHGAELSKKFAEAGYNFVSISYRDDDDYKREVIEEFSKPDTSITGLIATDILTKGFDVPDVKIGVSARPFSKSFASHVQQMGRVMRGHPSKEFALWLDHSGNYIRFRDDWEEVFHQGVNKLEEGKEKARKEPTEREKKELTCPKCSALFPAKMDTCLNCGHVRVRQNMVQALPGHMEELAVNSVASKQEWWGMLQWYVRYQNWSPGRAAHTYREKFGVWPRGLDDTPKTPSNEVEKFIRARLRAYLTKKRYGLLS